VQAAVFAGRENTMTVIGHVIRSGNRLTATSNTLPSDRHVTRLKRSGVAFGCFLGCLEAIHGISEAVELDLKSGQRIEVKQVTPGPSDQIALLTTQGPMDISVFDIAAINGTPWTLFEQQDRVIEKLLERLSENPASRGALLTPEGDADEVTRRKCYFTLTLLTDTVLDTAQWELVETFRPWWESAAQAYPRDTCSRTCLGLFYARVQQDWGKASSYFEEALAIDSAPVVLNAIGVDLGQAYIEQRENEKAEAISRKTLQANPGNLSAQFNLGASLINQHRFEEGLAALRTIVHDSPDSREAEGARTAMEQVEKALQSQAQ
jgi:tetratricopeptide (TPR) repeat protein